MSNAPPIRLDSPGPPNQGESLSDKLRFASERGLVDIVRELLVTGVGFRPDEDGRTALHYSAQEGHFDICKLLIGGGCNVNAQDVMGYSPLIRASSQGYQDVVLLMLSVGCDPDLQDEHGNAAIHEACWNGFSKTAELLTGHNCDVCLTNKAGFTALHLAAQNGHNESSRILIYAGCGTDLKNNYGDTALHTAARYGHAGVARILISAKCLLNEQNKNGDTSLHIASALKRRKIAKILVESGMDVNILNKQGETAMDVAKRKDHLEIVLIISTYTPSTPSPQRPVQSARRHGDGGFGVTFKDEIELADGPVVCPNEDVPLKAEPQKPEKERFLFFFKKKKKDKEKEKNVQSNLANTENERHHKSTPDIHHQHSSSKPAVHGFFSQYIPREGVQLYRDLAGNIKQGPIGYAPVCQCGPSLKRLETSIHNTKESLHKCVDSSHNTLSQRLDQLNVQSSRQVQDLRASMRQGFSKEHIACHARISERIHEERRETHALVGRANADMKEEIESWLHDKLASYGHCLDHHHDDTALPPRNLFLDFPEMGRLVRSRSDETLSVSDYSGKHRKKDFYESRKAAMEQIRGWDMPRLDRGTSSKERNNNNMKSNNNLSTKLVTKAQVHAPHTNENAYNSRENILSPSTNSTTSPGTLYNSSGIRATQTSYRDRFSSLERHQQSQHHMPNASNRISRTPVPNRAISQPRVSFSPEPPTTHTPRSASSPPPKVIPNPAPRSRSNPASHAQLRGQSPGQTHRTQHQQDSSSHQNLGTGGPPDTAETKSVEQGGSSRPLLNGRDKTNLTNGHNSAGSDRSALTGESSSNGSRNSNGNAQPQLTRYQDSYGVRFSRPRTLSSDSLLGDNPQPIPRSRSVENTLEDNDPRSLNCGYVTDSAIRSSLSTQSYNKNPNDVQAHNTSFSKATTRYRLPETSASFRSDFNSPSNNYVNRAKIPPPVPPKRNLNYSSGTQHPNKAYDGGSSNRGPSAAFNNSCQEETVLPYRPNVYNKVESTFSPNTLPTSLSISTPLTSCLQHDPYLSPVTSSSLPFANGNREDSTCSSNQDSGYDSRAHKGNGERKDGDTSGGTPSSSFSVERSNCNTPSYAGSPHAMQKESPHTDFKDSITNRLQTTHYGYPQSQYNGLNVTRSRENSGNRNVDVSQERKTDFSPYPEPFSREAQQTVFNSSNNSRNYKPSQSHYSSYTNNNVRNENNKYPGSLVHSSSSNHTPHYNPSSYYPPVNDSITRQQNFRNSQPLSNNNPPSHENLPGFKYIARKQPDLNYNSDGGMFSPIVKRNFPSKDAKDVNSFASERSNGGENTSDHYSYVPSHSNSQTPFRPAVGPPYRAPLNSTNTQFSSPYPDRANVVLPVNQQNMGSYSAVSTQNELNRDSSKSHYNAPPKNSDHPGYNSTTANVEVDATQTKVQAHIEGWYQRKLIEAAERLRQNHAYDQPTHDSYGDHQVYSNYSVKSNKQPSISRQSSPYQGWSDQDAGYNNHDYRRPPLAYPTTPRKDGEIRYEQNGPSSHGYYRSSPYSTDYNSSSERSDARFRTSNAATPRGHLSDSRQNGGPIHYDPIHGSDV